MRWENFSHASVICTVNVWVTADTLSCSLSLQSCSWRKAFLLSWSRGSISLFVKCLDGVIEISEVGVDCVGVEVFEDIVVPVDGEFFPDVIEHFESVLFLVMSGDEDILPEFVVFPGEAVGEEVLEDFVLVHFLPLLNFGGSVSRNLRAKARPTGLLVGMTPTMVLG